jgi:hypothetical protein
MSPQFLPMSKSQVLKRSGRNSESREEPTSSFSRSTAATLLSIRRLPIAEMFHFPGTTDVIHQIFPNGSVTPQLRPVVLVLRLEDGSRAIVQSSLVDLVSVIHINKEENLKRECSNLLGL